MSLIFSIITNLKQTELFSQPFIILLLLKQGCLNKLLLEKELTLLQTPKEDLVVYIFFQFFNILLFFY